MNATLHEALQHEEGGGTGGGGGLQEETTKIGASGSQNHLELRLGISLSTGREDMSTVTTTSCGLGPGSGFPTSCPDVHVLSRRIGPDPAGWTKRWYLQTHNGFVHPWSLAARQQKAAFEKAHQPPPPSTNATRSTDQPSQSPVIGWPPVHTSRRNLVGLQPPKLEMDGEKVSKRAKISEEKVGGKVAEVKDTMFVKVNMEGYAVGRKIDLKAHDSYESLSQALKFMFSNFLSASYCKPSEKAENEDIPTPDYLLIYEDHEGDRMLVGDVPWEMFITSVKRLYIAHALRAPTLKADENVAKDQK